MKWTKKDYMAMAFVLAYIDANEDIIRFISGEFNIDDNLFDENRFRNDIKIIKRMMR